jgi:hypothetical protein
MSRLPIPGADNDTWGEILNDFLAVSHLDDGKIRVSALPAPQVADGSITPAKLSQPYVPASSRGAVNGVATLDGAGKLPVSQLPSGAAGADATTTSKGLVQLAGDLGGTAASPTVPALAGKYVKPAGGIPETDLDSNVQTKLNTGGSVGDATSSVKGVVQLAGDLGGTATVPTVPGLANKISTSARGAANGVAALDGTGRVPVAQLPAGYQADATTTSKGIVQLAGDLGGTAAAPTVPGLTAKADDNAVMHLMGSETVTGVKVFTSSIEVPNPTNPLDTANKQYVDGLIASGGTPDATTSVKGIIQLAGDLGGTAASPTVPGLSSKADKATTISAGTGLSGGGDLSANRSLAVTYGTTAGTAAQGNDSRITGAEQTANKGAINGYASLDGSGKVPSAQLPVQSAKFVECFSSTSLLMVDTGVHRLYNDSGATWTINSVRASVGTAPTGSSVIVDINISGTTIFTNQANRPSIAAAANTSGKITNMDVTSVPVGGYLTVDVDQVGSTAPGSDLTVQVELQ